MANAKAVQLQKKIRADLAFVRNRAMGDAARILGGVLRASHPYNDPDRIAALMGIEPEIFSGILAGQHDVQVTTLAEVGALFGYSLHLRFVNEVPDELMEQDSDSTILDPFLQALVRECCERLAVVAQAAPQLATEINQYRDKLEARLSPLDP